MTTHSWILIGGTGQEFGLTASTLALLGVVPAPERVILIDADAQGELYGDLAKTLDIVRYARFANNQPKEPLLRVVPLEPRAHAVEHTLEQEFRGDKLLPALYAESRIKLDTSAGFKAEPQIGAASFFRPAFDLRGAFRQTLNHIPNTRGHVVSIVASVAGGTGSGLWQLVARLVRRLVPEATIKLLLLGPLMSLQQSGERDADGHPLTNQRLDSNASAGLRVALEVAALAPDKRPFNDLYLLGYPSTHNRPEAPKERTGRRASRMTLVAATMLGHAPVPTQQAEPPGVFLYGDDLRPESEMLGISYTILSETGASSQVPLSDVGFVLAETMSHLAKLRRTAFHRAFGAIRLFARRQVGRTVLEKVEKSQHPAASWKNDLDRLLDDTLSLLARFEQWVSNKTDRYPHQLEPRPRQLAAVDSVLSWQSAIDRMPDDPTDPNNRDYHLRRWIVAIGKAHLQPPTVPRKQPNVEPQWLLPVTVLAPPQATGWSRLRAENVLPRHADCTESFPTPFAKAYWNVQNIRLKDPSAEQQIAIHATQSETRAAWLGLVGSTLELETTEVSSIDVFGGFDAKELEAIEIKRVCSLIEEGRFAKDSAGRSRLQFLKLREKIVDPRDSNRSWAQGRIVGAVHPLSGPFFGPNDTGLAEVILRQENRPTLDGLLAHWVRSEFNDLDSAPVWVRAIFSRDELAAIADVVPEHVQATRWTITLDSENQPRTFSPPVIGARPRALRLRNRTHSGTDIMVYPVLPAYDREHAEREFIFSEASAAHTFAPPREGAGTLVYETLPGKRAPVSFKADYEDLEDWNIEVFPGDSAPREWTQFGVAIEPAGGLADHRHYRIVIYLEADDGRLRPHELPENWAAHTWVTGRPRLMCIFRKPRRSEHDGREQPAIVGFFPLLGPAHKIRQSLELGPVVALDLGTSRSFMAVKLGQLLTGGTFRYPCKRLVSAGDKQNTSLGAYCHWHPLRRMDEQDQTTRVQLGELGKLDYEHDDVLRHSRVMLLPSNLVRRIHPPAGGARSPFADYSISAGSGLPDETQFRRLVNLKWSEDQDALSDFVTLLLLTGIAELDAEPALSHAPRDLELRLSFPLAFHFHNRQRLQVAIDHAVTRTRAITGIQSVSTRYLDESMAGMFHVGLGHHSWKLSLDIGGGTADIALMHDEHRVVADSVHLGGDLVIERHARRRSPSDSPTIAMGKFGHLLRGSAGFAEVFNFKAPELSSQLLSLAADYVARVLAGAIVEIDQGRALGPPSDATRLREGLGTKTHVSLYVFGGAWRLAELTYNFVWSPSEETKIQRAIGKAVEDRANNLLQASQCARRVEVAVHHNHLHRPGGEKAAVALGLLSPYADGLLKPNITGEVGIVTVNGLDEDFEGRERTWHEWVGSGVTWRTSSDVITAKAVSQPRATPAFENDDLREWSMEKVIAGCPELQMRLTPTKESPYYRENNRERTRGAMAVAIETCFARKFSA